MRKFLLPGLSAVVGWTAFAPASGAIVAETALAGLGAVAVVVVAPAAGEPAGATLAPSAVDIAGLMAGTLVAGAAEGDSRPVVPGEGMAVAAAGSPGVCANAAAAIEMVHRLTNSDFFIFTG